MSERRYTGAEIEKILRRATERREAPDRGLSTGEGLTLRELQEIGEEVGISPERMADAASTLDRSDGSILPLSVRHTVSLPRDPTDPEWERLVADLRSTFEAPGNLHVQGNLRGWSNGNLHAFVEPTESGYRLRMGTTRGNTQALFIGGGVFLSFALVVLLVRFLTGGLPDAMDGVAILSALGLGMMGVGALPLSGWARKRRRQMQEIGGRLVASMTETPED